MHIQQIELDNFKSFGEKTIIPFRRGFTTVSGPNGSGKSNIIDGILFCLGLSSSRTMRAERLPDLINNLSRRREALVTITFHKDEHDQPSKAEASDSSEREEATEQKALSDDGVVTVTRRIKDGPNGYTSTYYLNGKSTTLMEVHEHLSGFNISPGCYNVMMQGDVAGIVNMSALERRKIIDEIAGVAEFDRKIDQANEELTTAGTNIERNQILLQEINTRLEQLSSEREHALKYQKLRDERQTLEGQKLVSQYASVQKALTITLDNIAQNKTQRNTANSQLHKLLADIDTTREALQAITSQVKKKGEDQQIAIKKQIEGLKGHIARKEDAIRFIDEKTRDGAQQIQKMQDETERRTEQNATIDEEIAAIEHSIAELEAKWAEEKSRYDTLENSGAELSGHNHEWIARRTEVRQQLEDGEQKHMALGRERLTLESKRNQLAITLEHEQKTRSEWSDKHGKLTARSSQLAKQVEEARFEKTTLESRLQQQQNSCNHQRVRLKQAQARLEELNREYIQKEARKKAYDEVSFSRPVETVLRSDIDGVHGTLAQLGEVDDDYAMAVETAMGGRMQNVVVDDESIAQECVELLQRQRAGRATFLPLNKIAGNRRLPPYPREGGVVDFAINLIRYDNRYSDVFSYALGDTLVVEDFQVARRLMRQYRMVTLDGSLFEKSGAITGGGTQDHARNRSRFASAPQVDTELVELEQQLRGLMETVRKEQQALSDSELAIEKTKQHYADVLQRLASLTAEQNAIREQLDTLSNVPMEQAEEADNTLAEDIAAIDAQMGQLDESQRQLQTEIDALKAKLKEIEDQLPADQMEQLHKAMADVKFQMDHYQTQIRNAQSDIKEKQIQKQYHEAALKDFAHRKTELADQADKMQREKLGHQEEITLLVRQIQELEAQTQVLDEELKKLQDERDVIQAQFIELEKQKHLLERQIAQCDEQRIAFQSRRRELEQQISEQKAKLTEAGVDVEAIDVNNIPEETELDKRIDKLQRQMQALEPVNMLAIQEYDDVNRRKEEFSEKIDTLNHERETLHMKIASYHELKLNAFMKAYESVDTHFKTIYAELSDGIGQLELTNPAEPFSGGLLIQAQPRGKKMQRLESMSGGEKSITSLAFVFALQRFRPAPFYALDEVDMNLDGMNAEKLANMVKRESDTAQFIVVSLRKPMIEHSDRTVGVTQKRNGVSKVTGIQWRNGEAPLPMLPEINPETLTAQEERREQAS